MLPLKFISTLACPLCKGELMQNENGSCLCCKACGREYPIVEGIPVLFAELTGNTPATKCESP